MSTGMQQSQESATRNGINALAAARDGVQRCSSDVEATRLTLTNGYGGSDGAAFSQLVTQWQEKVGVITMNLEQMIEELQKTLREHGKQQQFANEQVALASSQSNAVYNTLSG
ncbi:hypothetical protein [Streptomyces sp. NPDC050848]|uniref:hypothetical protein n=1 Tax=Streptomyces sp. NPDC050848 TaxID=3155791 RepID=UPI0033F2D207